jgi:hypothetical protein
MKRLPTMASALSATVAILASCTDGPTRPPDPGVAASQPASPVDVSSEPDQLRAALLFADVQSSVGLRPETGAAIRPLVATVVQRLAARDAAGMARALAAARATVRQHRELAKSDGTALVELAAIDLILDRATAFVNGPSAPETKP